MINPEIDRLYDDELLDDGSNSFDRYFLPYFDSIHLDPKKIEISDVYDFYPRLTCNSQRCNLM